MPKKEQSDALYLVNPDTKHVELVHGEDVDDSKAKGWKEPDGDKANGEKWNDDDSVGQRNAAAEQIRIRAKIDAEKKSKEQKEREEAFKASEKAKQDAPQPAPDMTVRVVD